MAGQGRAVGDFGLAYVVAHECGHNLQQEAISTTLAAGDSEVGTEQHHSTPSERRDAWLLGWSSGDPSECGRFIAA